MMDLEVTPGEDVVLEYVCSMCCLCDTFLAMCVRMEG
jgi:hypothetical protein